MKTLSTLFETMLSTRTTTTWSGPRPTPQGWMSWDPPRGAEGWMSWDPPRA